MIVPIAAKAHHRAHIAPVARLLGLDADHMQRRIAGPDDVALIASYGDLKSARRDGYRRIILMQHGAGQSYGGDRRTARHPCYAGGDDNDDVGLFLVPNQHAHDRWLERYPTTPVEIVGCPRLDELPSRDSMGPATTVEKASPVVAVSFHWNGYACPEWRSAFDWYRDAIVALSKEVTVLGHEHPNRRDLGAWYRKHGIEYTNSFDDVLRRADVYATDNSSTLYEFAFTGRPVLVLNAPWYRPAADHGLRFWDARFVGENVDDPAQLDNSLLLALNDSPTNRIGRAYALKLVYDHAPYKKAAQRAADAIAAWAGIEVAA
jgi:hypothetical protein